KVQLDKHARFNDIWHMDDYDKYNRSFNGYG
ncbi:unnamed protein product, partial [marine sediment metagenome]